jgi:hypothetical protein
MKNQLLFIVLLTSSIIFTNCKAKVEVDPDNASQIVGTYKMSVYNTDKANNSNPVAGNNLVVTEIDKNNVNVLIHYADPKASDVVLNKMLISTTGGIYNLSQTFSNANATGKVSGTTMTLDVKYSDNTYVHIVASK